MAGPRWSVEDTQRFQEALKSEEGDLRQLLEAFPGRSEKALYNKAGHMGVAAVFNKKRLAASKAKLAAAIPTTDPELVAAAVSYKKQTQRFQDTNRIERKSFREYARIENAVTEYGKELVKLLEAKSFAKVKRSRPLGTERAVGVLHLTDLHLNELIHDVVGNRYDFTEAGKRLRVYVDRAKVYFNAVGVRSVLIATTGDLLNSDRRLDELLNQATNRAKATLLAVDLLQQVIQDMCQDYSVTIASVTGNESRTKDEWSFDEAVASDNYDFTIMNMLRYLFKDNVTFVDGPPSELLVNVAGQGVLLMHGFAKEMKADVEKAVMQLKGRYATKQMKVDYVLMGHLHSARIGDTYARGSSLAGANAYSEFGLQLDSRASQNIHIFYQNGNRDSIKIDLQTCGDVAGYNVDKRLEAYHAKSVGKLRQKRVIFEVVV